MKATMSGFDLRAVARELNHFSGAYVKKAYMPHYEQIVLRIQRTLTNLIWFLFEVHAFTPPIAIVQCQ